MKEWFPVGLVLFCVVILIVSLIRCSNTDTKKLAEIQTELENKCKSYTFRAEGSVIYSECVLK